MIQFNKGKGYKGIRTIKIFEFENTRSFVKKCWSHWEKRKTKLDKKKYGFITIFCYYPTISHHIMDHHEI